MNHPPNNLTGLLFIIALIASLVFALHPKNSFAGFGVGVGWTPSTHIFSDAGGAQPPDFGGAQAPTVTTDEPQNPAAEQKKEPEDIQDFAARVAKEDQERSERGASAPNIPATSQNLARFHQRDTLPEQERKALQPIEPPKTEEAPANKAEAVAAEPPAPVPPAGQPVLP